jgi:hypothetical protein
MTTSFQKISYLLFTCYLWRTLHNSVVNPNPEIRSAKWCNATLMPFCVPFWYTWPPDQTHHWHNLLSWQHQRINSMDQSSAWKVNNSSAGLAIHGIFRNSSSLCSQKPDTCHSSEPDQSNPPLPNQILDDPFMPRSSKWFLPSCFPTKTLYAPLLSPHVIRAQSM